MSDNLDIHIERARAAGDALQEREPRALHATVEMDTRQLVIMLADSTTLRLDVDQLEGLQDAPADALQKVTLTPTGSGLHWEDLDADLYVPALVRGVYGTRAWMQAIGKRGGHATSQRKSEAARKNGAAGGRPRHHVKTRHGLKKPRVRFKHGAGTHCAMLVAGNGRTLLTTRAKTHTDALSKVRKLQMLVVKGHQRVEETQAGEATVIKFLDEKCRVLAESQPYRDRSSLSRARTTLPEAIKDAQITEDNQP